MKVKFGKLHDDAVLPAYAKAGDAGMDLVATSFSQGIKEVKQSEGKVSYYQYGTGLSVEIPEGHVGLLFPRSSVTKSDLMLKNSVGVIDSGYRGEICLRFYPTDVHGDIYKVGERIGQLVIMPIPTIEPLWALELSDTERGQGGFGSTGE